MTQSTTIARRVPAPDRQPLRPKRRRMARTAGRAAPPRWAVSLVSLTAAVALWAVVAAWIDDPIVPSPADVFSRVVAITVSGEAFTNFASSIGKIAAGFALAMVGGLVIGFLMGRSQFMTSYFSLPLFALGNMPGLTYAVFGLLIFGVGPRGTDRRLGARSAAVHRDERRRRRAVGRWQAARHVPRVRAQPHRHRPTRVPARVDHVRIRRCPLRIRDGMEGRGTHRGIRCPRGRGIHDSPRIPEFQVADMLAWTTLFIMAMVLIERAWPTPRTASSPGERTSHDHHRTATRAAVLAPASFAPERLRPSRSLRHC